MKTKLLGIAFALVIISLALAACSKSDKELIVGNWQQDTQEKMLTFDGDGLLVVKQGNSTTRFKYDVLEMNYVELKGNGTNTLQKYILEDKNTLVFIFGENTREIFLRIK
jgi:hypothetical protein